MRLTNGACSATQRSRSSVPEALYVVARDFSAGCSMIHLLVVHGAAFLCEPLVHFARDCLESAGRGRSCVEYGNRLLRLLRDTERRITREEPAKIEFH